VTYWQNADIEFTGTTGWFKYPESVTSQGSGMPVNGSGDIDPAAWTAYQKTVEDGTFFGAYITGGGGAQMDVLKLVPESAQMSSAVTGTMYGATPWPSGKKLFFHQVKCKV